MDGLSTGTLSAGAAGVIGQLYKPAGSVAVPLEEVGAPGRHTVQARLGVSTEDVVQLGRGWLAEG